MEPAKRRGGVVAAALGAALILLIPIGYVLFLREPPPPLPPPRPPPPSPPAVAGPPELRLSQVEGEVRWRRRGADAGWSVAQPGLSLAVDDEIQTSPTAAVEIEAPGSYRFRLEPGTSVGVDELAATVSRFLVDRGMITAEVAPGERRVVVRASNSDAVASTQGGAFVLTNSGQGTVAVGTREGEVELAAAGKVVIVRSGQQSLVQGRGPPGDPTPIPASLLLKVHWPTERELNKQKLVVSGRTAPGSHVIVAGTVVPVERDGRFQGVVLLREGANDLTLTSRDVGGRVADSSAKVTVDSTAPKISTERLPWER